MSETESSSPPPPAPRLNRDTLLLIGALALLALGVALTFIFSPGANDVAMPVPTATSERPPTQIAPYPAQTSPMPAGGVATVGPAYPATQPTVDLAQTQTSVVLELTALAATVQAETALTATAITTVPAYPVPEGTPPSQPTIPQPRHRRLHQPRHHQRLPCRVQPRHRRQRQPVRIW